jgi:Caspase domain
VEGAAAAPAVRLTPPPRLDIALLPSQSPMSLRVHAEARGTVPLKRISFYADGQPIYERDVTGTAFSEDLTIPGAVEARWLTAQAIDSNGLVSAPQSIRRAPPGRPTRQLHAVLVGNDVYSNPGLTLKYARHDAERLGAVLKSLPGQFYAKSTVGIFTDAAATPDAIRGAIKRAVATANVEDTIVVSFAGHGLQDDQGAYYLTPYGFDDRRVAETALAWRDIAALLHSAKARVIVILDACHAGLSGSEGRSTNDDAVAALVAGEHSPMLVLAASKGRQVSYEGPNWDGGVFTYALVTALKAKRADYDLDRDGVLEISELYRALRTIVARETKGGQSPWLVREDLLGDFVVF